MVNPKDIKDGVRVILPADEKENLPEERGVVEGSFDLNSETCIVRVDDEYMAPMNDDGLREVGIMDMELETINPLNLN